MNQLFLKYLPVIIAIIASCAHFSLSAAQAESDLDQFLSEAVVVKRRREPEPLVRRYDGSTFRENYISKDPAERSLQEREEAMYAEYEKAPWWVKVQMLQGKQ